jgi:hypothetical protein
MTSLDEAIRAWNAKHNPPSTPNDCPRIPEWDALLEALKLAHGEAGS